ncbi:DUF4249 family protein [Chryseolinea sp. T2]|uniref:DUF4249 family protein n=1 Tax=Chryseolinea sp. T2 TaxID=3129255 RepID=UPI0030768F72
MRILQRYLHVIKCQLPRIILFGALSGCLTPIDVNIDNTSGIVVISGQVSNIADQTEVQVGLTADTDRLPFPVSEAAVNIIDETTGESIALFESSSAPGIYHPTNYAGVPGHAYHVEIELPQRGSYRSETDVMPDAPGTIQAGYEFKVQSYTDFDGVVSDQPFLFVYVDAELPEASGSQYLKWNVDEVFLLSPTDFPDPFGNVPPSCLVAQRVDPQRVTLYDGTKVTTRKIDKLLVAVRIVDWTFLEKHAITVYQSAISARTHTYWHQADLLSNQTGSIFDTPPAELKGNVHGNGNERVFGLFSANAQALNRFFLYRSDLPFPLLVTDCVYAAERSSYPDRCLDCTSVRNSSYNRPDWF